MGASIISRRILGLMPPHLHYVEPFFGGGAVLLTRDPGDPRFWLSKNSPKNGVSEVANDINGRLINFWRVLQSPERFREFSRQMQAIPVARDAWTAAHEHEYGQDPVADAVAFFVDCRQSRSGLMTSFTAVTRNRTRRGMNGNVSEWLGTVEGLPEIHNRLQRVLIENMPAVKLIRREDTPTTLFYCDPPYLHETRKSLDAYAHEMQEADHVELLETLKQCQGKVMLSGYPSPLYAELLKGWAVHEFDLPNNAASGTEKQRMTEVVWCNF